MLSIRTTQSQCHNNTKKGKEKQLKSNQRNKGKQRESNKIPALNKNHEFEQEQ